MVHLGKLYPYYVPLRLFAADLEYPTWWPTELAWSVTGFVDTLHTTTWPSSGRGLLPQGWEQGQQEIDYVTTVAPLTGSDEITITLRIILRSPQVYIWPQIDRAGVAQTVEAAGALNGAGNYVGAVAFGTFDQFDPAPGNTLFLVGFGLFIEPVPWNAAPPPPAPVFPWIPTPS